MRKMRNVSVGFLILSFAAFLGSCGPAPSSRLTAESFLSALAAQDFKKAQEYATDEAASTLSVIKVLMQISETYNPLSRTGLSYSIERVSETGDTSVITYSFTNLGSQTMYLKKVANEWKVDFRLDQL